MSVKRSWHKLRGYFPLSWHDALIAVAVFCFACGLCLLLRTVSDGDIYIALIFVLAVVVISLCTEGFFFGSFSSVMAVVAVNYVFTYPFMAFNFTISGYPLTFLTMLAVSIIICTLTSRLKQQEKLRVETERETVRANLLRAISHDLRTPLTSIIGATTAILENHENLTREKEVELLLEVQSDADWLIRMVENLLSITRIGTDPAHANLVKTPEAVEEIISEAVQKFKKRFQGVTVSVKVPRELLLVPMDAMLIEQVIMNIMENSVQHGRKTTKIRLAAQMRENMVVFTLRDDGVGITSAALPNLFSGYTGATHERSEADNRRSMGIGLSVCKSIILAHGGTISAENLPHEAGAIFTFALPASKDKDIPALL